MNMFNLLNLFTSTAHSRSHLTHCMSVRWRRRPRKPSWLGVAKTKIFKLPPIKDVPEVEQAELNRLKNIYERQLLSLKEFMVTDKNNRVNTISNSEIIQKNMENCKSLINEWNAKSAELRKDRLEKEKLEQEETALRNIEMHMEKLKYLEAKVDEIVTAEIAASSTFVTKENLDMVLDECLNNIKDYNFAIDLKGNIYRGESTVPVDKLKLKTVNEMISDIEISDSKNYQSKKNLE